MEPHPTHYDREDAETKAHRCMDAAFDLAFERGRMTGLRDAKDFPDQIDNMIKEAQGWL